MLRSGVAVTLALVLAPALARAQALSLTAAMASGDCTGTTFSQAADVSGRFLAVDWAVAGQFAVPINRGRVRCNIRLTVTIPAGHRIVVGGANGVANRMAIAQLSPLRLNGTTSRVLVESVVSIDGGTPTSASGATSGGVMTFASLAQERPVSTASLESACATATKTSFLIGAVVDAATASNYVVPWPPEPYVDRESASASSYRLFYSVVSCAPTRTAVPPTEATITP
jgi:hypothetical protein